jgi:hypothetical protein
MVGGERDWRSGGEKETEGRMTEIRANAAEFFRHVFVPFLESAFKASSEGPRSVTADPQIGFTIVRPGFSSPRSSHPIHLSSIQQPSPTISDGFLAPLYSTPSHVALDDGPTTPIICIRQRGPQRARPPPHGRVSRTHFLVCAPLCRSTSKQV